jgi:hypothetical protein
MGGASSSTFEQRSKYFRESQERILHNSLGEFFIVQDHLTHKFLLKKEIQVPELKEEDSTRLLNFFKLSHPNLIQFEGYKKNVDNNYSLYCESFDSALKEEITNRAADSISYSEEDILGLLRNVMSGLLYLSKNNSLSVDISLANITTSGPTYKIYLLESLLDKGSQQKFSKISDPKSIEILQVTELAKIALQMISLKTDAKNLADVKNEDLYQNYTRDFIDFVVEMKNNPTNKKEDLASWNKEVERQYSGTLIWLQY